MVTYTPVPRSKLDEFTLTLAGRNGRVPTYCKCGRIVAFAKRQLEGTCGKCNPPEVE